MQIAYIVGPYRAKTIYEIKENIRRAEQYAVKYWQLGYAVICPHKNSAFFDGIVPDQSFLDGDIEIIKRCDIVVMTPGWEKSSGSVNELEFAKELGLTIIYEG